MTINFNNISDYNDELYDLIKTHEGVKNLPYIDSKDIPTIGT